VPVYAFTLLLTVIVTFPAQAEVKEYIHTVKQAFSNSQSPDEARKAAIARAKHEVLEKAGTFLESHKVVKDGRLESDELRALSSAIMNVDVISQKNYLEDDTFGIILKVRIHVDTSILHQRIKDLSANNSIIEAANNALSKFSIKNINKPVEVSLINAYAYYIAQEDSLFKIADKFPDLNNAIRIAHLPFKAEFEETFNHIQTELAKRLPKHWLKVKQEIDIKIPQLTDPATITRPIAEEFIKTVSGRAKGQMESPILETFLTFRPSFQGSPEKEYLRGFRKTYRTNNHLKAKGVDFQIDYPASWFAEETRWPNTIQGLKSENGRGFEMVRLMVKELPDTPKPSKTDLDYLYSKEGLISMLDENMSYISSKQVYLDNQIGGKVEFKAMQERLGHLIKLRGQLFVTVFENKMISLFMAVSSAEDKTVLETQFQKFEPLFGLIANSLVINSKWE
jgi:hypothetical protein